MFWFVFALITVIIIIVMVLCSQRDKRKVESFQKWWFENFEKDNTFTPEQKIEMAKKRSEVWGLWRDGKLRG